MWRSAKLGVRAMSKVKFVRVFVDDRVVFAPPTTTGLRLLQLADWLDMNRWLFRTPDDPRSPHVVQIGERETIELTDGDKFHTTPPCHW